MFVSKSFIYLIFLRKKVIFIWSCKIVEVVFSFLNLGNLIKIINIWTMCIEE